MVKLSSSLPGLDALWAKTLGSSAITVGVLDGPVDQAHACFAGAVLTHLSTLVQDEARAQSAMSNHGTHVASVIFGQPGSAVRGLAPRCSGLLAPVFTDDRRRLSQLDLARAIEQAVQAGAQVINVSGGQLTDFGEAEDLLERAHGRIADSSQLFGFTRVVNRGFSAEERIELMEMLWQVVYADGRLDDYEANLMRRLAGLVHVSDRDSGEARKRALERLGQSAAPDS